MKFVVIVFLALVAVAMGAAAVSRNEVFEREGRVAPDERVHEALVSGTDRARASMLRSAQVLKGLLSPTRKRQANKSPACQAAEEKLGQAAQSSECEGFLDLMQDFGGVMDGTVEPKRDQFIDTCKKGGCRAKLVPRLKEVFAQCPQEEDDVDMAPLFDFIFDFLCLRADNDFCLPKFTDVVVLLAGETPVTGGDGCERPFSAASNEELDTKLTKMCHPCIGALFKLVFEDNPLLTESSVCGNTGVCANQAGAALSLMCLRVPGTRDLCISQMDEFGLFCPTQFDETVPAENLGDELQCTAEGNLPNALATKKSVDFFCHKDQCLRRFFFRTLQFSRLTNRCCGGTDAEAETVEGSVEALPGVLGFPLLCAQDPQGRLCTNAIIENLSGENNADGTCASIQEGFEACPRNDTTGWLACGEGACKDAIVDVTDGLGCCTVPSLIMLNADKPAAEVREGLRNWAIFTTVCTDNEVPAPCLGRALRFRLRLRNVARTWYASLDDEQKAALHDAVREDLSAKLGKDVTDIYVTGEPAAASGKRAEGDDDGELKLIVGIVEENTQVAEVYAKQIQNEPIPLQETSHLVDGEEGAHLRAGESVSGSADSGVQEAQYNAYCDSCEQDGLTGSADFEEEFSADDFNPPPLEKDDEYYVPEEQAQVEEIEVAETDGASTIAVATLTLVAAALAH